MIEEPTFKVFFEISSPIDEKNMGAYYCVNINSTMNPGCTMKYNTVSRADDLGIVNRISLGYHSIEISSVQAAKAYYSDADGCVTCCPKAHKG